MAAPTARAVALGGRSPGALYFVIGNGLVIVAEKSVSSGLVAVLVATMPLWATLFERFTGARIGRLEWVGIALGLTGVVVLNLGGDLRASGGGAVCALVAPMGWASASIVSKRLTLPKGPMCTAAQMLCGGVALAVVSRVLREPIGQVPSARSIAAMAYLVVFGSLVGFTAYVYLLRNTRMSIATSYAFVNPVIALALGVALAGERIERASAFGAVIILAAVVLITRGKSAVPAPEPESAVPAADPALSDAYAARGSPQKRSTAAVKAAACTRPPPTPSDVIASATVGNTFVGWLGRRARSSPVTTARKVADWKPEPRMTYATRSTTRSCFSITSSSARRASAFGPPSDVSITGITTIGADASWTMRVITRPISVAEATVGVRHHRMTATLPARPNEKSGPSCNLSTSGAGTTTVASNASGRSRAARLRGEVARGGAGGALRRSHSPAPHGPNAAHALTAPVGEARFGLARQASREPAVEVGREQRQQPPRSAGARRRRALESDRTAPRASPT